MSASINGNVLPQSLLTAMNGTTSSSSSGGTAGASSSASSGSSVNSVQNQFMTLLVTQLQNQDPLNPMDNAQITSQMAQLSTVTGINQLNTTLQSLMSAYQANQSVQAASMIGKNVLVNGSTLSYSGSPMNFGINLASAADTVNVSILNASGQAIDSFSLGAQPSGVVPLQWDGTTSSGSAAPSGNYTIQVKASSSGNAVTAQPLVYGTVSSVVNNGSSTQVDVSGVGPVDLSSVAQIY